MSTRSPHRPSPHEDSPHIICTVDVVALTLIATRLHVALLQRAQPPAQGDWALPGGYVHAQTDADTSAAARRVLADKLGMHGVYLEQLATFSGPRRDPRGWSLSVAHCALLPADALPAQGPAGAIRWVDVQQLPGLPFDHAAIVAAALARVRNKSQYSSLPVHLCGEQFTLPQLQAVYEAVLGDTLNKVSFRRKMDDMGLLEAVPGAMLTGAAHRPAQFWRVRPAYRQHLAVTPRGL
ncbi:NUDIX hydrolase [Comamonas serinivorans]|uniref:NUDIX hydrolase n=1 Tax=Comamonas serinivorans TaxID=1082851 RepID=A0A1Y0EJW8_9BURK|nr:NUDIX domain-containing protein [Comamonas serinivorans]ARU03877.1 NUDIX hydrolase [Comamonas serinivorans]